MTRRAAVTQYQIERAIRAAKAAGIPVAGFEIDGTTIRILTSPPPQVPLGAAKNAADVMAERLK
jgi:hypothetical protein